MASQHHSLVLGHDKIGRWTNPSIVFPDTERPPLRLFVVGTIINSVTTTGALGRARRQSWKERIATEVKALRGRKAWNPREEFAVSIGFSFHPRKHGNHLDESGRVKLDVENFVKPVVDALAAGLFCSEGTDLSSIPRWDYDDSNFNSLLIHRLPDAIKPDDEGIAVCISSSSSVGR